MSPSASTRNFTAPATAAPKILVSVPALAGLMYMVESETLEVPDGHEGEKT